MIVRLTPKYKFVCDRCGKEWFDPEDADGNPVESHKVVFSERQLLYGKSKEGEICSACAKECWRLMDFDDADYVNARNALNATYYNGADRSGSQLYKQAGNSIVVNCLCEIFKKMI